MPVVVARMARHLKIIPGREGLFVSALGVFDTVIFAAERKKYACYGGGCLS